MPGENLDKRAFNDSCHLQKNGHFSWVNSCCLYLEAFGIDSNLSKLKNMRPKQFKVLVNRALRNSFERYWTDFKRESYSKLTDKSLGRCFAKFRCSNHRLLASRGQKVPNVQ